MPPVALFGLSIAFSLLAWGLVTAYAIWPALRERSFADAMRPLLLLHSFRFIGLSFLVPGVVSGDLPVNFTFDAAYGDVLAALLAVAALASLRTRFAIPLLWIFNLWGSADLLNAFYQANAGGIVFGHLGATFFIPTVLVPFALITHGLMFGLLVRQARRPSRRAPLSLA
ncbi:MAG: hypothetical protein JSR61_03000 [Proteobacteria bacterium]|nr:hypothetical protein [Pseudomonadota bacterium]